MYRMKLIVFLALALLLIAVPVLGACTKEVVKEVEVEVPVVKEVVKEVPVETIVEKEVPIQVIKEVPVETIVEKEVIKEVAVERIVEKQVIKEVAAPVTRKPVGTLTYATSSMGNETWLPWRYGSVESGVMSAAFETPLAFDVTGAVPNDYICQLCEEWEVSEDELTVTFKLREGIQFHDGWGEMTSEDFLYLWNRGIQEDSIWTPKTRIAKAGVTLEADGPYKLIMKGEKRYPRVILDFGVKYGQVSSKRYIETVGEDEAAKRMIGTGPFRMVEHEVGSHVRYEALDEHWRQVPYFKTIIIKKVPEEATRIAMLKAGEADIIDISLPFMPEVEEAGFEARFYPTTNPIYLSLGGQILPEREAYDPSPPWVGPADDENALKVRKALNLAIDKEAIIEHVLFGGASPVGVPYFNPGEAWTDPAWEPYPYDPEQAKKLLAEAGYPNGFELDLAAWSLPGRSEGPIVVEAVALYWEAIGVKASLQTVEYAAWRPYFRARNAPIQTAWCYVGTRSGKEPVSITSTVAYSGGSVLIWNTEYPELDAITDKILVEGNLDKRAKLQMEWGQWVYDHYTAVPIATKGVVYGINKRLGEWPLPNGTITRTTSYELMQHGSED